MNQVSPKKAFDENSFAEPMVKCSYRLENHNRNRNREETMNDTSESEPETCLHGCGERR